MDRMPMYPDVELNEAAVQILVAHGRRLRAEAFRAALGRAAAWVGGLARAIAAVVLAAAGRYRAWRQRHRAIGELLALDERTLRDIGLSRNDVARLVRQLRRGTAVAGTAGGAEVVPLPRVRAAARAGKLAA